MSHAPICPHDPIQEIAPDLFMVRGSIRLNPLMRISRNMAILRHSGELTLVNPVRLEPAEDQRLRELGRVTRLLELGSLHGVDAGYYVAEHGAQLLRTGESTTHPEPKPDLLLREGDALPFPGAELFHFSASQRPEAALLVHAEGGVLVTCDAIQHYGDYSHNTWLARIVMPFIGFPRRTVVGPIWLKLMTPEGGSLEGEFRRLLGLDFDWLLSAHGTLLRGGAKASVASAVEAAFAKG